MLPENRHKHSHTVVCPELAQIKKKGTLPVIHHVMWAFLFMLIFYNEKPVGEEIHGA